MRAAWCYAPAHLSHMDPVGQSGMILRGPSKMVEVLLVFFPLQIVWIEATPDP
jgi:hypothetical protein